MTPSRKRGAVVLERARDGLALCALVAVVLFCALGPIAELDVFTHLTIGRWIVEHHALPHLNVWSAADQNQSYHSAAWLWQVLAAVVDRRLGLEGLRVGNAFAITACVAFTYLVVRRRISVLPALLAALLLFVAFQDRVRLRPHVVDLGLQVLLLAVLLLDRLRPIHLALAFVAAVACGSLHAPGAGLAVILVAIWSGTVFALDRRRKDLLLFAGCAAAGWLLSPGALAWLRAHDNGPEHLEELRAWPAWFAVHGTRAIQVVAVRLLAPVAAAMWVALALAWRRARGDKGRRADLGAPRELVWAALCIVVSVSAWHAFYFAALGVGALMLGARRLGTAPREPMPIIAIAASVCLALVALHRASAPYPTIGEAWGSRRDTLDDRYFPSLGAQLLAESQLEARVATLPAWGGYVTYLGFPKLRTTVDTRMVAPAEVLSVTERIQEVYDSGQHAERLQGLFALLPADFLLVPRRRHTERLTLPDWAKVSTGAVEDLWLRKTPGNLAWIQTLQRVTRHHQLSGLPGHHMD
jgi:hypothetical protein